MKKIAQNSHRSGFLISNTIWLILAVVILAALWINRQTIIAEINSRMQAKKGTIKIETVLHKLAATSELSTSSTIYNGVAEEYDNENPEEIARYIYYEGRITAGIDFEQIKFSQDDNKKKINIKIPETRIINAEPVFQTMEFMNIKEADNPEEITSLAIRLCKKDMKKKTEKDKDRILAHAKENAVNLIKAWTVPIAEHEGYTVTVE